MRTSLMFPCGFGHPLPSLAIAEARRIFNSSCPWLFITPHAHCPSPSNRSNNSPPWEKLPGRPGLASRSWTLACNYGRPAWADARTDCAAVERADALADAAQAKRAPDAHANT